MVLMANVHSFIIQFLKSGERTRWDPYPTPLVKDETVCGVSLMNKRKS